MVPYADFNLLKFPDREQAIEKIADLTLLSDIFPTGYHGAVTAGIGPGSIAYVAGAGPVGLAAAASCHLLGAACVIVGASLARTSSLLALRSSMTNIALTRTPLAFLRNDLLC